MDPLLQTIKLLFTTALVWYRWTVDNNIQFIVPRFTTRWLSSTTYLHSDVLYLKHSYTHFEKCSALKYIIPVDAARSKAMVC